MALFFQRIGIMAKPSVPKLAETVSTLLKVLEKAGASTVLEERCAAQLSDLSIPIVATDKLHEAVDLVIVIGGDGSLLSAARLMAPHEIPVLGVNRGTLGFLTDISPKEIPEILTPILHGEFQEEKRTMLSAAIMHGTDCLARNIALNDVVLYSGQVARMVQFEIWANGEFICSQRSDGLITATPTGSTAYALSGGGPILHPSLSVLVLVPMHPHTLSSRPLVLDANAAIELRISPETDHSPLVSCDGQVHWTTAIGDTVEINLLPKFLRLIHPKNHNFFHTLRSKLAWNLDR